MPRAAIDVTRGVPITTMSIDSKTATFQTTTS